MSLSEIQVPPCHPRVQELVFPILCSYLGIYRLSKHARVPNIHFQEWGEESTSHGDINIHVAGVFLIITAYDSFSFTATSVDHQNGRRWWRWCRHVALGVATVPLCIWSRALRMDTAASPPPRSSWRWRTPSRSPMELELLELLELRLSWCFCPLPFCRRCRSNSK